MLVVPAHSGLSYVVDGCDWYTLAGRLMAFPQHFMKISDGNELSMPPKVRDFWFPSKCPSCCTELMSSEVARFGLKTEREGPEGSALVYT